MRITLVREPLEQVQADMLAYGAKDTGEMGGGAAASLLRAAGPSLEEALREGLASTSRGLGEVVITPAFDLGRRGVPGSSTSSPS